MTQKTMKSDGGADCEADSAQSELWWVLEWLVEHKGQRRTAEILGVNRKTVALALRRQRLTGRMVNAIEVFMASLNDPAGMKASPLDQMVSRIELLTETVEELYETVEGLVQRVQALEEAHGNAQAPATVETEVEADAVAQLQENEARKVDGQAILTAEPEPKTEQAGRGLGWWRR